jgi:hypothetical protein
MNIKTAFSARRKRFFFDGDGGDVGCDKRRRAEMYGAVSK